MDIIDTTTDVHVHDHDIVLRKAHYDIGVETTGEFYSTQPLDEIYCEDDAAGDDEISHEGLAVSFQVALLHETNLGRYKIP
jgi:hypothetical protein